MLSFERLSREKSSKDNKCSRAKSATEKFHALLRQETVSRIFFYAQTVLDSFGQYNKNVLFLHNDD